MSRRAEARALLLVLLFSAAIAAAAPPHYENVSLPSGVVLSTLVAGRADAAAPVVLLLHGGT